MELARACVAALRTAADFAVVRDGRATIIVAPNVELCEEHVALDATRYPGIVVPADARAVISRLVEMAATIEQHELCECCLTGFCNGALVAAYAAVCARASAACRNPGAEPRITSVTFGIPIGARVPSDTGTHYVSTRHTACMHPGAIDTAHVTWLGERDSAYYANRLIAFFVRPAFHASLGEYDACFDEGFDGRTQRHEAAVLSDDEWQSV
jgi:hypothetical protein